MSRPHNVVILVQSLEGRARAFDQLAGMVESMTVYGRKRRRYKAYLVAQMRQEARRCRTDLEMATENLHGIPTT